MVVMRPSFGNLPILRLPNPDKAPRLVIYMIPELSESSDDSRAALPVLCCRIESARLRGPFSTGKRVILGVLFVLPSVESTANRNQFKPAGLRVPRSYGKTFTVPKVEENFSVL